MGTSYQQNPERGRPKRRGPRRASALLFCGFVLGMTACGGGGQDAGEASQAAKSIAQKLGLAGTDVELTIPEGRSIVDDTQAYSNVLQTPVCSATTSWARTGQIPTELDSQDLLKGYVSQLGTTSYQVSQYAQEMRNLVASYDSDVNSQGGGIEDRAGVAAAVCAPLP